MKFLVTGGAGFVGSHVVRRLLADGHDATVYDSLLNYVYPLDARHLYNHQARAKGALDEATLVRGSTQDLGFLTRAVMEAQPTHIIHLAAMPLAKLAMERPEEACQAIIDGTMNILQAARALPDFQRVVYVSSSMVYGDFESPIADENHPKNPKEVYGGLKLAGEILTQVYGRLYGLDVTIVRPSAVYGPTDNNRRVLSIFLENALDGKPLEVRGADQKLDFTYVTDLADGIILAATHPAASGQVFNLTRGEARTIKEAADIVARLIPGTVVNIEPKDETMPSRGTLDVSRARRVIGYDPTTSLEEGLALYLAYLQTQRAKLGG